MPELNLGWLFILIVLIYLLSSIKILREYERGVIFRLGRVLPQPKGPGVILVFAPFDRIVRVSLRIDTLEVQVSRNKSIRIDNQLTGTAWIDSVKLTRLP